MKLLFLTILILAIIELAWPSSTHTSAVTDATMTPTPVGTPTRTPGIGVAVTWDPNVYLPIVSK